MTEAKNHTEQPDGSARERDPRDAESRPEDQHGSLKVHGDKLEHLIPRQPDEPGSDRT